MGILTSQLQYGYSWLRSGTYALQREILPLIELVATGKKRIMPSPEFQKNALKKVEALLKSDVQNIQRGYYPPEVLRPYSIVSQAFHFPTLLVDAFQATRRKARRESKLFDPETAGRLKDLPAYYARNFHYQKNGYLSEGSADLYDHQVEVLFAGTANPMRRQIIPAMKHHFRMSDGEGLNFLEIGSGTGSLTRFIALAFPRATITCLDLSEAYLEKAARDLKHEANVRFIQGAGEKLPFKRSKFDAVFSCFLFHELPAQVRGEVCAESFRVLKKKGFYGFIDSLQLGDDAGMDWALKLFPADFHEPFFKNYISHPMEHVLENAGFRNVKTQTAFLSKVVHGKK